MNSDINELKSGGEEFLSVGDRLGYEKDSKERMPWEHYLDAYGKADPVEIAARLQIPYDQDTKCFTLPFLGSVYEISWPEFQVSHHEDGQEYYPLEEMIYARILTIRFLLEGSAVKGSGRMKTYREMPWGEVYFRQFQGRCIFRLAYGFGGKLDQFQSIMERLGGVRIEYGDCGYEFEFMNNLRLRFILWAGDDEFPPSAQILFADNFSAAFHGEDMAVVGDVSIGVLKALSAQ